LDRSQYASSTSIIFYIVLAQYHRYPPGNVRQRNSIFAEGGVIGLLASILVWVSSDAAYL